MAGGEPLRAAEGRFRGKGQQFGMRLGTNWPNQFDLSGEVKMNNRIARYAILSFTLMFGSFLSAAVTQAQNTADIIGTVTDQSGGAIANANVTLKSLETNSARSMQTGPTGEYAFTLLQVGAYSVTVEAKGFKLFTAARVTVATGDRARVDAHLEVGAETQTVVVEAETITLQTDSATVGSLLTARATQDLPTNGRNVITLVQMAPGASEGTQSSLGGGTRPDDRRQTSTVSANGQNDSVNNFLLDGMDNNERSIATTIVKPSIDSIQEVKVLTSLFSADTGRVGGAVINMTTKSGTNNFHGTLFEFFRNDKFDAKDTFNVPQAGNPLAGQKEELRQNQFGASLGGPIRKNKTFFYVDYEGLRKIRGQTQTAFIPTPCELGAAACNGVTQLGNFFDLCTEGFSGGVCTNPAHQIYDPVSHNPISNNLIPSGSLNPIASNYAKLYPILPACTVANSPTSPNCEFVSSPNITQVFHTADLRIDHHFSEKDVLFARYTINNGDSTFPGAFPGVQINGVTVYGNAAVPIGGNFPGTNYGRQQNLSLGWDHIFRPNLLLDLRAGVSRYVSLSSANNEGHDLNSPAFFGGPGNVNVPSIKDTDGLALVSFQTDNYSSLGDQFALPTDYWDTNFQYMGDLAWTKGAHDLKFGGSAIRRNWTRYQQIFKGWFQFNSAQTSDGAGNGGNAFASLLSGLPFVSIQNMTLTPQYNRAWEYGAYVQDNWRVNHWLTLNLGIRYDVFPFFTDKNNAVSNFDPTDPGVLAGGKILVAGQSGVSGSANIPTQHNMFQPRFGFAASLAHEFVLRGGFGTSYFVDNAAGPSQLNNQPFATNVFRINQPFGTPFPFPTEDPSTVCLVAACGAAPQAIGSGGYAVGDSTSEKFQNGLLYMGNLTLEKAFGASVASVGWVGEAGRHLARTINDINLPAPPGLSGRTDCGNLPGQPIAEPSPCQPFFSQLPYVGLISLLQSDGESSYNALNAAFTRRLQAGLTVQANYTYAQSFANSGGLGGPCDVCSILPNNARYDRGYSDFDVRHRVVVEVNYALPFGKSFTGVIGQAIKGWQTNAIYSFASGLPFTVDSNASQTGLANTPDRPNVGQGDPNFHQSLNEWFDISKYQLQPFGFPGNEARNQVFSPAAKRVDFSLFKDFTVREQKTIEFRAEFFNLTNTPTFAHPSVGNYNQISSFNIPSGHTSLDCGLSGVVCPASSDGGLAQITATSPLYTPRQIQFALKFMF